MNKYRRIEINAYHRRVTVVSGEWRPGDAQSSRTGEGLSLNDSEGCEPVEPDSPEGQVLLVDAVRSLERRLSPETRATLCEVKSLPSRSNLKSFYHKLRSFFHPKNLHLSRNQNSAAKQSAAKLIPLASTVADGSLQLSRPETKKEK